MEAVDCSGALVSALQNNLAPLRSMLIQRTGNEDDALDLLQDTYLRCAEVRTAAIIENPRSYVWRLALNLVIDYKRSCTRRQRLYCDQDSALQTAFEGEAGDVDRTRPVRPGLQARDRGTHARLSPRLHAEQTRRPEVRRHRP